MHLTRWHNIRKENANVCLVGWFFLSPLLLNFRKQNGIEWYAPDIGVNTHIFADTFHCNNHLKNARHAFILRFDSHCAPTITKITAQNGRKKKCTRRSVDKQPLANAHSHKQTATTTTTTIRYEWCDRDSNPRILWKRVCLWDDGTIRTTAKKNTKQEITLTTTHTNCVCLLSSH